MSSSCIIPTSSHIGTLPISTKCKPIRRKTKLLLSMQAKSRQKALNYNSLSSFYNAFINSTMFASSLSLSYEFVLEQMIINGLPKTACRKTWLKSAFTLVSQAALLFYGAANFKIIHYIHT